METCPNQTHAYPIQSHSSLSSLTFPIAPAADSNAHDYPYPKTISTWTFYPFLPCYQFLKISPFLPLTPPFQCLSSVAPREIRILHLGITAKSLSLTSPPLPRVILIASIP
jgi:hypothetical protein